MPIFRSLQRAPFIVALIMVMIFGGCSQKSNYARVRPYSRDLANGIKYYTVKSGDTLYSVGFRSGHDYHQLAAWNDIRPPYKIHVGQRLKLFKSPAQSYKKSTRRTKSKNTVTKKRISSQKTPIISKDNKKVLKLYWQWPLKGKLLKNFYQTGGKGIDINGKKGYPIRSAASGKVVYSGQGLIGYGNLLIIKHNEQFLSAYANNRRLLVKEGHQVKKGQIIAEVGLGVDRKAYLHFEIRKNGKPVNPVYYMPKK